MNLRQKLLIGGGIFLSSLLPMNSLAQDVKDSPKITANTTSQSNIKEIKNNWNFSVTLVSLHPHDSDLKDIFKSYLTIQPEAQRKIAKDIYLGVNGTFGWGSASGDNMKIYAFPKANLI